MIASSLDAMKPTPQSPQPTVSMVEERDNPAMTEFKRQEAEDRVAFAQSLTQDEWRAAMENSRLRDEPIKLAPKPRRQFPFKPVQLPW
jgi:hypothetical protein